MVFRVVLVVFLSTCCLADFFDLSEERLRYFISRPMPNWIKEQVQGDLEPFKQGVSKGDFDYTYHKLPVLIKIKIHSNQVSWESAKDFSQDNRLLRFLDLLNEASSVYAFPDCEFLLTVLDCFDYPENLEFTKAPVFTICKQKRNHKAVLYPEMRGFKSKMITKDWIKNVERSIPWHQKKPIAFWRGRSTGFFLRPWDWDSIYRVPLVLFSEKHPDLVDARFSGVFWSDPETRAWLVKNYVDGYSKPTKQAYYKYLVATDGNTFPSSLIWQLAANSTVIKNQSDYVEWFYKGIQDQVHYVSYETDCSDLKDVILDLIENDEKARRIAKNATRFADMYLTAEGAAFYMYCLLTQYAQLSKFCETP